VGIEYRPYQIEGRNAVIDRWRSGVNRQIVSWATGLGKTVLMGLFCQGDPSKFKGQRLILAHREELIDQAASEIRNANPALRVGIERERFRPTLDGFSPDHVVVASVPSIVNRLKDYDPAKFSLVVVDECHHATAPTYLKIIDHFGFSEPKLAPDRCLLGLTATPERADNKNLARAFDEISHRISISDGIKMGYLTRIRGHKVYTDADLRGISVRAGDFVVGQLSDKVNTPQRNALCVKTWRDVRRADYKRGIVFCVDVNHARVMADAFQYAGVKAEAIWGEMESQDRRDVLKRLSTGEIDVVTNCAVLTEGFNEPSLNIIIMARPTRSALLYTQMCGRGTRLCESLGKTHLDVFDITDNSDRLDVVSIGALFGFGGIDPEGNDVLEVSDRVNDMQARYPGLDLATIKALSELDQIATRSDAVDLLVPKTPKEIESVTKLAWIATPDGDYKLSLWEQEWSLISKDMLGAYSIKWRLVVTRDAEGKPQNWSVTKHSQTYQMLVDALREVERWVKATRPEMVSKLSTNAVWRGEPATAKQMAFLRKLDQDGFIEGLIPSTMTAGEATALIDAAMTKKDAKGPSPKQVAYLKWKGLFRPGMSMHEASSLIAQSKAVKYG